MSDNLVFSPQEGESSPEHVAQCFLDKLEEEWDELAERSALSQADYLRWAVWMIHKFHLPLGGESQEREVLLAETTESAIRQVARRVESPPALVALELQRLAEQAESNADVNGLYLRHADLATSPRASEGNSEIAA